MVAIHVVRLILWKVCMRLVVGIFLCVALCGCGEGTKNTHKYWDKVEDDKLIELVANDGKSWEEIAQRIEGRNARQCKERWELYLAPVIDRAPWTKKEDQCLLSMIGRLGPKWALVAKYLPTRSASQVRVRYLQLLRQPSVVPPVAPPASATNHAAIPAALPAAAFAFASIAPSTESAADNL